MFDLDFLTRSQLCPRNTAAHCARYRGSWPAGEGQCNVFTLLIVTVQVLSAEVFMERHRVGEPQVGPCRVARCVQMSEVVNVISLHIAGAG